MRRRKSSNLQSPHLQSGQAYIEFIVVLPIFLIIIAGVIGFGRLMYAKLATQASAWSACRHAIASLDEMQGTSQAIRAATYTLDGFSLDPEDASISVTHWGQWGRGKRVSVRVCYGVPPAPIPFGDAISPQMICSFQTMPVNQFKSRW